MKSKLSKSVSVIIASYNRKNLLQRNLEALNNQKFKGALEIIVVDDGSTDGTTEMLAGKAVIKNKFILKYFRTSHLGPANARNLGIINSRGEILIFLDDDSVVQNEFYVQKIVESFKQGIGIVAGRTVDFYSGALALIRAGDPPEIDFDRPEKLKEAVGVPTKNAAFLREAVKKAGGFNPVFKYVLGEDVDLCIRILNLGYKLAFNKESLVFHYPSYNFSGYIKKSYYRGYSCGIFRSIHPGKSPDFSPLKTVIFPLLAIRSFVKKTKECYSRKLFSKSIFRELILMFILIMASYGALHLGEMNYQTKKTFTSVRIRFKALKDLIEYFFEFVKCSIKATFPPYRKTFLLYLTNRCNQRCRHCFYSRDINKNIQELSLNDLGKIAKNYYRYTDTNKLLARNICQDFTGGEPFLRNDLLDVISLFKKEGVRHFQINTNGMLTDRIIDLSKNLLSQGVSFRIVISLDGLEKTHDKIRNIPGAFKKSLETIKQLKEMGAEVGTIMTINRLNYREIGAVMSLLNDKFGIEPGLQLVRSVGQSNAPVEIRDAAEPLENDILITKEIVSEIRSILLGIYLEKSVKNPLRIVEFARKLTYLQSHLDILEKRRKMFNCVAGKSVGVIYQNGDVSLCEFYKPIGNLKEAGFDLPSLWNGPLAQKQRTFIKDCFCNHDCFINTEYNFRFAKSLMSNINELSAVAVKNLLVD